MTIWSTCESETENAGAELTGRLRRGSVAALSGDLGAGKTAFVRGMAKGLGLKERVTSPTFTIVNEYVGELPLFHFDLYRLEDEDELFEIGWDDYLERGGVVAAEWSEKIPHSLPKGTIYVHIEKTGERSRRIDIQFPEDEAENTGDESSAKPASVAVCDGKTVVGQYFMNAGLTHSATLLKMTGDILQNLKLDVRELDYIAVASGPGSFTGIRIGVSAVVGLAWGADLPVCGVSTLEAMAHQVEMTDMVICPVMVPVRSGLYASFELRRRDRTASYAGQGRPVVSSLMRRPAPTAVRTARRRRPNLARDAFWKSGSLIRRPRSDALQSAWGWHALR
jgi:tRNA threonylcarbamoyladenosine biosynthesis protein TsaE